MADYGLLGGLAEGLKAGVSTYRDVKRDQLESDRARRLQLADLMAKGLMETPEGGLAKTDFQKEREATELGEKQAGLLKQGYRAVYDPTTGKAPLQAVPGFRDLEREALRTRIEKEKAETSKLRSETDKRNPDLAGISDDPAKLVPHLVPKEHQAQAFKEIDAAENTRKMAQSIMDSFDQAIADSRGAGRATSYLKTPRSVQALHQAMQPTFKDLEGTVRQAAMENTFTNITPKGVDTDKDIATRRAALQDYLQSKLSAPTARAYGIDLSRFASTAPYRSGEEMPGRGSGLISEAYAGGVTAPTNGPTAPQALHQMSDDQLYELWKAKGRR